MKDCSFPFHTFIIFIIGLLVYAFTFHLIKGNIFALYSENNFDIETYYDFWKNMTSEQRLFLSETYYKYYINMKDRLEYIKNNNKNNLIEIKINEQIRNYYRQIMQSENIPFVVVSLIPKNNTKEKRLLICAHFDGHNLTAGGTAYDDGIQAVSMIGAIDALSQKDIQLDTQIDFLFDGAEEFGFIGAFQYVDYLSETNQTLTYDYLNLEGMGAEPPYVFVIKNNEGNYRIQKALSYTRGSILLSSNYILGNIGSSTDHEVFNQEGWLGGVSVFLGKGSVYHTKYDRITDPEGKEHLKITGNQLIGLILNYESEGYSGNSIGFGIAPICVVLPITVIYVLIPIFFIASVAVIIIKERRNKKEFVFDLLKQCLCFIIVLIIFLIIGILLSFFNSNSASANQAFVILVAIMGLFLFLIFQRILNIKKWSRFRLVFDLILMICLITTDLSLPLLALTILSAVFYFFDNKIVKYIIAFFQYLIISLIFGVIIQVLMQMTSGYPELLTNLLIFLVFFIFSYHISASPLDLHEIPENEKLKDLIIFFFKRDKINYNSLDNDEPGNIISDLLDDSPEKTSSKNRFCDKMFIPVYLFFIYILYFITLLLILFLKPYPFSKSYILTGHFLNVYNDSQNSTMIFHPHYGGFNYAKKHIMESEFKDKFREVNVEDYVDFDMMGKSFAVDSNSPLFEYNVQQYIEKPNLTQIIKSYTYEKIGDNKYNFTIYFDLSNSFYMDRIIFAIYCSNCVLEINGQKYEAYSPDSETKVRIMIKKGKEKIEDWHLANITTKTNIILNTDKFDYILYLNTMKTSEDYLKFLDSFGEATCKFGSALLSDCFFTYKGSYTWNNEP
jgi:hypothetical protein